MRPALTSADVAMRRAVVEGLYVDAMLLADEAQALFVAVRDGDALPPNASGDVSDEAAALWRIGVACESLKTTTRLMHIIAWLLHRRAMIAGDPGARAGDSAARIGEPVAADWGVCVRFETPLRRIVAASERLFERIAALEAGWETPIAVAPVQAMLAQLEARL